MSLHHLSKIRYPTVRNHYHLSNRRRHRLRYRTMMLVDTRFSAKTRPVAWLIPTWSGCTLAQALHCMWAAKTQLWTSPFCGAVEFCVW